MKKYETLLNILDQIRAEAGPKYAKKYAIGETNIDWLNAARSRAFIHLFLKVGFGLVEFEERERNITDGANDGGIDGYFIHGDSKTIFFIQSKFRTTEDNFENKEITLEEILAMDITRILEGEPNDITGKEYSGKIKQLQRDVSSLDGIARYKYKVILLANLTGKVKREKLEYLTGGYQTEIIDYQKCYNQLVFPVVSGTYYNATDLNINIDLSNKNAGSKIRYDVQTQNGDCEITVLFVPTLEMARVMSRYKNSILRYNPRSYLELEGQKVNEAIKQTILGKSTNEFALFNNGITMLSDESNLNEKIGQKNKAQLTVKNPQIINGGQTAYTLSKLLETAGEKVLENKEVLLKVVTLVDTSSESQKLAFIESISTATNQQTPVIPADRFSNETFNLELQEVLFNRYGILFERKRGEFFDGLSRHYIDASSVIERNLFYRILYSSAGKLNRASTKKLFQNADLSGALVYDFEMLDRFYFAFLCFRRLVPDPSFVKRKDKSAFGQIYAFTQRYKPEGIEQFESCIGGNIQKFLAEWQGFVESYSSSERRYNYVYVDKETGEAKKTFRLERWFQSRRFENAVLEYFGPAPKDPVLNNAVVSYRESDINI